MMAKKRGMAMNGSPNRSYLIVHQPLVVEAFALTLEARQRTERDAGNIDLQPQTDLHFPSHAIGITQAVFDFNRQCVQGTLFAHGNAIFDDFGEATEDFFDRAREDVDAADDEHVVGPSEDAALEKDEVVVTGGKPWPNDI